MTDFYDRMEAQRQVNDFAKTMDVTVQDAQNALNIMSKRHDDWFTIELSKNDVFYLQTLYPTIDSYST